MNNITFVIFTFNEEKRIERVIRNVCSFGNVLIADNKSKDRTQEIAKAYNCDILVREKEYIFVENQELTDLIYERVSTDWIFWMFADEMLDNDTLQQIESVIKNDKHDIINIYRKNYFYGNFCNNLYQSANHRIFKKGAITFVDNRIHGMGKPTVAQDRIYNMPDKYFIHQFINYTATSYLNAISRYTESEIEYAQDSKKTVWYLLFRLAKNLIKDYFFSKGYKVGFSALALTELTLFYEVVKNIRVYEKEYNLSRPSIDEQYDVFRDRILSGINK